MKKLKKSMSLLLAVAAIFCIFTGCVNKENSKVFTKDGYSITLTDEFVDNSSQSVAADYDFFYSSDYGAVAMVKQSISDLIDMGYDEVNELDYAKLLVEEYSTSSRTITTDANISSVTNLANFSFTASNAGQSFYYYVVVHKNSTHYFITTFYCFNNDKDTYQSKFEEWSKTITI